MTDEQKNRIRDLRQRGCSYRQISDDMDISINTVKSFCRRYTGEETEKPVRAAAVTQKKTEAANPESAVCRFCGKPLIRTPGKRAKEFCDSRCRSRYWTAHRNELSRKTTYTFRCVHCGKEFTVYGKRDRKYCSKECYFAGRFGGHGLDEAGGKVPGNDADI